MAVKDYLDPRWQEKRLRIMDRDGFTCICCASTEKTLHVHHRAYEKGKRIWDTPEADLITLCEDCHENVEAMVRDVRSIGDRIQWMHMTRMCDYNPIDLLQDLSREACRNPLWGIDAMKKFEDLVVSLIVSSPHSGCQEAA